MLGRCLRPGLSAHTAQALATWPVSAATPNAKIYVAGDAKYGVSTIRWLKPTAMNRSNVQFIAVPFKGRNSKQCKMALAKYLKSCNLTIKQYSLFSLIFNKFAPYH
jgi:hypothetical protein